MNTLTEEQKLLINGLIMRMVTFARNSNIEGYKNTKNKLLNMINTNQDIATYVGSVMRGLK